MINPIPEEKVKPFKLVKYFTFSSLVAIFLGTLLLFWMNSHWARAMQLKKSEEYARVLVENLNHQVFMQFALPVALKYGGVQLRDEAQYHLMDQVVRNTLHSFKVDMVNIYDFNNVISYSMDKEMIGKHGLGGEMYKKALDGKLSSKLIQKGNPIEILLGIPKDIHLVTFAPVRVVSRISEITGPVLGVVEIVLDLSEDYKTIYQFQTRIIFTGTLVMGILFLVLLFVVKRGETIFEKRAEERLQLKEKLNRAEHLSSLGEMAAKISHEIRNPLGIIKSSAALLKKKMNGFDPSNPIPDVIVEETNRLNDIITDFFNYAKPRSLNLTPCRVEEVLEKNITFLTPQLDAEGYRIKTHVEASLPEITADTPMLYQAFLNLLINAMQAMPGGGNILVEISSNGKNVSVVFEDHGEGIPDDLLEKIWEPFFTTKEKGTGLGLGIVKNIVDSHNGSIRIENRSTGGARVTLHLPVRQGAS